MGRAKQRRGMDRTHHEKLVSWVLARSSWNIIPIADLIPNPATHHAGDLRHEATPGAHLASSSTALAVMRLSELGWGGVG